MIWSETAIFFLCTVDYVENGFFFFFESTFTILQPTIASLFVSIHYISKSSALILGVWETFERGDQCGVEH